ncbi:MAG: hypothetical protein LC777_03620 [Actinobacteria bacterium]|nr:hypothetical protein [Actinomycetota bacterium]
MRERVGAVFDPARTRMVAEGAIRATAEVKNHPPDLINVALELLVKESLELPGFSTLDRMASGIRSEVNASLFETITARMAPLGAHRMNALLEVAGRSRRSPYDRLKRAAGRASWSGFREQVGHLTWVDSLGNTDAWLEGIAESKIADFAGEARAADAAVMRDISEPKRTALLACLVHEVRRQARDELAEMFCKRVAVITKRAKAELDGIRAEGRELSERLIEHYRDVLRYLDPRGSSDGDGQRALELARETVERAGGFDAELEDIESVAAHHANNYMPLVARQMRRDRATMFSFTRTVELEATSADRAVLDARARAGASASDARPDPRSLGRRAAGSVVCLRAVAAADRLARASGPA